MQAYASRTGTKRTLAALRAAGWGLMVSAKGHHSTEGFDRWCFDNGAWTAHTKGVPFDEAAFLKGYEKVGRGADFAVLPDIVAGGLASLAVIEADEMIKVEDLLAALKEYRTKAMFQEEITQDIAARFAAVSKVTISGIHSGVETVCVVEV